MSKIGVIAALPVEAACLTGRKTTLRNNVRIHDNLWLHVAGIGDDNATRATKHLLSEHCQILVSWGLAAGLSTECQCGDLVLAGAITDPDVARYLSDADLLGKLKTFASNQGMRTICGDIARTTQVLANSEEKRALQRSTSAIAADMESAAIARLAGEHEIPHLAVRVISDDLATTIPQSVFSNMNADGEPVLSGLLYSLFRRPADLLPLFRLMAGFTRAKRTLQQCRQFLENEVVGTNPATKSS